jgi:hypothetical protein
MVSLHTPSVFPANFAASDPLEQMARDDREDWILLRLVVCVAVATVLMAAASTFMV